MYVDIGQEEPLVVKAEAAVPIKHGERAQDRNPGGGDVSVRGGWRLHRAGSVSLTAGGDTARTLVLKLAKFGVRSKGVPEIQGKRARKQASGRL